MSITEIHKLSATDLHKKFLAKELSCTLVARHYLDRIEKYNKKVNAYISVFAKQAIQQAEAADKRYTNNDRINQMLGIPTGLKDIFCMQGTKTSCGSKMLANFISPYTATIVNNLERDGAVILGKLNMDEFAMGSSNENSYFGPCKNPWDLDYVPGGSSGGSAAAISAGLAAVTTGTDTGGSIRQPASLCGITGLKPTYGRVSRHGMVAFASSLDQCGPMAKSAADCAAMLQSLASYDPENDSTSINQIVPDYSNNLNKSLEGMTFGLPKELFTADLDKKIFDRINDIIEHYKNLGVIFKEVSLPNSIHSIPTYYILATSECSSNLARFDGIRYGHRHEGIESLEDLYAKSRSLGFGTEVKRRIMLGTYALSGGFYGAYYQKAQKIRALIRYDYDKVFSQVDAILGPTTPNIAFKIGDKLNDPISMYLSDIFTTAANLASLPAISAPAGFIDNMPIGFQITTPEFKEDLLLNIVHKLQEVTNWHMMMPKEFEE